MLYYKYFNFSVLHPCIATSFSSGIAICSYKCYEGVNAQPLHDELEIVLIIIIITLLQLNFLANIRILIASVI